ncbi:hypothetical protein Mpt1_c10220 [Candidatus Methanoplasma termitum]|uniref:Uncharacterized protein n=1 Tax=Candidatus Methanoplasma termitum TaxID=1577791 RepID=A0A0A7LCU2_9ARCH|nr:hypothetical protein [Candidatus Methanoplasma termitum]AIZ56894.1 hypothetical protein Mpt1_c10220 [Candidatus Methanoplasma termitum]
MSEKFDPILYTPRCIMHSRRDGRIDETDRDGYLYSNGIHKTKILPKDLPEWFILSRVFGEYGYVSAKGVKHLFFEPNYHADCNLDGDVLYISYFDEIKQTGDDGRYRLEGYDLVIRGPLLVDFVSAAEEYSGYDITSIVKELKQKEEWFNEHIPKWY